VAVVVFVLCLSLAQAGGEALYELLLARLRILNLL
jgi:hypothetical protein